MLQESELNEMEALANAASVGNWHAVTDYNADDEHDGGEEVLGVGTILNDWQDLVVGRNADYETALTSAADFRFIAAANPKWVLSAIAQIRELEKEAGGLRKLVQKQRVLLMNTVDILRGAPPELTLWSHHDIAEHATAAMARIQELEAKIAALSTPSIGEAKESDALRACRNGSAELSAIANKIDKLFDMIEFFFEREEWGGIEDKLKEYNKLAIRLRNLVLDLQEPPVAAKATKSVAEALTDILVRDYNVYNDIDAKRVMTELEEAGYGIVALRSATTPAPVPIEQKPDNTVTGSELAAAMRWLWPVLDASMAGQMHKWSDEDLLDAHCSDWVREKAMSMLSAVRSAPKEEAKKGGMDEA